MKRKLKGDLFCPFTTFSLWERGQVHSDLCVGNIGWNAWLMCVPSFARARFLSEMICSENFAKASVQLMEYVAGLLTTFDLGVTFILFPQQWRREKLFYLARLISCQRSFSLGENLGCWKCVQGLLFKRANMWGQKHRHSFTTFPFCHPS